MGHQLFSPLLEFREHACPDVAPRRAVPQSPDRGQGQDRKAGRAIPQGWSGEFGCSWHLPISKKTTNCCINYSQRILVHSHSKCVLGALLAAHSSGRRLRVLVTESGPDRSGARMHKALTDAGIPSTLILDAAVGSVLASPNKVKKGDIRTRIALQLFVLQFKFMTLFIRLTASCLEPRALSRAAAWSTRLALTPSPCAPASSTSPSTSSARASSSCDSTRSGRTTCRTSSR